MREARGNLTGKEIGWGARPDGELYTTIVPTTSPSWGMKVGFAWSKIVGSMELEGELYKIKLLTWSPLNRALTFSSKGIGPNAPCDVVVGITMLLGKDWWQEGQAMGRGFMPWIDLHMYVHGPSFGGPTQGSKILMLVGDVVGIWDFGAKSWWVAAFSSHKGQFEVELWCAWDWKHVKWQRWRHSHGLMTSFGGNCSLEETPNTRKGGVSLTLWPCHLHEKSILRQKKKYGNSNISPCKNILIFKISSKRNQNPSRYYNSIITNLKFQHKP
jgi:hypothetical protein